MNYKISALAKSDLRDIYIYSLREFGEQRSDKYLESLYAVFEAIGRHPEIGLVSELDLTPTIRKFPALSHVIYYVVTSDIIEIRRVFHGSRDIKDLDMRPFQ